MQTKTNYLKQAFLFVLSALFVTPTILGQTQNVDTLLYLKNKEVFIKAKSIENDSAFIGRLQLKGKPGERFKLGIADLNDAVTNRFVETSSIIFPAEIKLDTEGYGVALIKIKRPATTGRYVGEIVLWSDKDKAKRTVPLRFYFLENALEYAISTEDQLFVIRYSEPSWWSFLLPNRIKQDNTGIRVENKTLYPGEVEHVIFELKGVATQRVLDSVFFETPDQKMKLPPKRQGVLKFSFKPDADLKPDEYKGIMQVYLKDQTEPLTAVVQLFYRASVFWALLVIVLGFLVGYMFKDLEKASFQIPLMKRLLMLNKEINRLEDSELVKAYNKQSLSIEKKIDKVFSEESKAIIEAELKKLEDSVNAALPRNDLPYPVSTNIDSDRTKQNSKKNSIYSNNENDTSLKKKLYVFEKRITSLIKLIVSGDWINAKWRYWLFRPIANFILFSILVYVGLHELYIKGGDTFGSEGFFDYLKLFIWGTVSNVTSRALTSNNQIMQLIGKKPPESTT